MEFIIIVSE